MKLSLYDKLHMRHRFWRYRRRSEVSEIRYVLESNLEGKILLDIGANKGIYSYFLSLKAGPYGKVYAFEAQPELGEHLQSVKDSFKLENLHIINKGLSSKPGILKMGRAKVGDGKAGFHYKPGEQVEEIDVPVITLDEFFADETNETIHFIKCDVEAHEYEVLKGGEAILKRDFPNLLLECNEMTSGEGKLFGYLEELGYEGFFYFVQPEDRARYRYRDRGYYVRHTEFANPEYNHPGVQHPNYIFTKDPDEIQKLLKFRGA